MAEHYARVILIVREDGTPRLVSPRDDRAAADYGRRMFRHWGDRGAAPHAETISVPQRPRYYVVLWRPSAIAGPGRAPYAVFHRYEDAVGSCASRADCFGGGDLDYVGAAQFWPRVPRCADRSDLGVYYWCVEAPAARPPGSLTKPARAGGASGGIERVCCRAPFSGPPFGAPTEPAPGVAE